MASAEAPQIAESRTKAAKRMIIVCIAKERADKGRRRGAWGKEDEFWQGTG